MRRQFGRDIRGRPHARARTPVLDGVQRGRAREAQPLRGHRSGLEQTAGESPNSLNMQPEL